MKICKQLLESGKPIIEVKNHLQATLNQLEGIELEYFEIVDKTNLEAIETYIPNQSAMCIAAFLGKTRLIDNMLI